MSTIDYYKNDYGTEINKKYINIVKGVAIFCMLWGHVIQCCAQGTFDFFDNPVFKFIYSFHMPLFMLISGYLFYYSFKKRDLKELIIHRSKPLLWTIFACSAFNFIITSGLDGLYNDHTISQFFNGSLFSRYTSLWFLWSVLSASIGVAIICKKISKLWLQILMLFLWSIVVYAFPQGILNIYMYPYYVIGFYCAKYGYKIKRNIKNIIQILSIIVFIVMLLFFKKKYYIYTTGLYSGEYSFSENLWINFYRYVIGMVGCITVISITKIFFNCITIKKQQNLPLSYGLSKIGEKSLQIYALSISLLSVYLPYVYAACISKFIGYNILAHNMYLYNFVYTPIIAIGYLIGLYWVIKFFEKIKFSKILFGK